MTHLPVPGAVARWLDWTAAGGARPATLELRRSQLCRLARETGRDVLTLGADDLAEWLAGHEWGPDARRSHRTALRSFYRWAFDTDLIAADPSRFLRSVKPGPVRPRAVAEPVLDAALAKADDRCRLMLLLAAKAGLRRAEIAQVHSDDLVPDLTGWSLVVHGKGGKIRTVPLTDELGRLLRGRPRGWVFPNGQGTHLTPAHTGKVMRRALELATAHQLRHRFATVVYQKRHDLEEIRELLGHASLATTQRYVAVDRAQLRAAVEAA